MWRGLTLDRLSRRWSLKASIPTKHRDHRRALGVRERVVDDPSFPPGFHQSVVAKPGKVLRNHRLGKGHDFFQFGHRFFAVGEKTQDKKTPFMSGSLQDVADLCRPCSQAVEAGSRRGQAGIRRRMPPWSRLAKWTFAHIKKVRQHGRPRRSLCKISYSVNRYIYVNISPSPKHKLKMGDEQAGRYHPCSYKPNSARCPFQITSFTA